MAKYYCWLDAGHSKATSGKRNTVANPNFFEWEFNNDIAVKLKKRLEEHGIIVYLTNSTPSGADMALSTRANVANNKWKELGKPSDAIFVSLHGNASTGAWANARGVEVYHANNASEKSKKLALLLTNQIYKDIYAIDKGFKNRGRKSANFTVIYKANMPSVLIEHGFYDNKQDLALMQDKRNVFVEADCKAICEYFGIAYKSSTVKPVQPSPQPQSTVKTTYYRVVTGSFLNRATAESERDKLKKIGYDAFLVAFEKNGKSYLRVVAISSSKKEEANKVLNELKAKGYNPFIVTYVK